MSRRKTFIFATILTLLFLGVVTGPTAAETLQNKSGKLSYTSAGIVFEPTGTYPAIKGDASAPLWSVIMMEDKDGPGPAKQVPLDSTGQKGVHKKTQNGFELVFDHLVLNGRTWNVFFKLIFEQQGDAFVISAEIRNGEKGWFVHSLVGPLFNDIQLDIEKMPLLLPAGMGRKINLPPTEKPQVTDTRHGNWIKRNAKEYEYTLRYPGFGCTLQYFLFAGEKEGLSFSTPDPKFQAKNFCVRYNAEKKSWTAFVRYFPCLQTGDNWKSVVVAFRPYQGNWHKAADHYRNWINSIEHVRANPEWIRHMSGMMLYIMKQQKGRHVMWHYNEIGGIMSDIADQYGFDFLALFGWAHGGHDHLYPEYYPDDVLGGKDALVKGIAQAKARGKRVYLYTNGQLMDTGNPNFWPAKGEPLGILQQNGKINTQNWQKFSDQPGFTHALACSWDPRWYDILLNLAKRANSYGADGILFDQMGTGGPMLCFSKEHGHPTPYMCRGEDNANVLKKIADEMKAINPQFAVLTEGLSESQLSGVAYFHGCALTFHGVPDKDRVVSMLDKKKGIRPFPEMFRYTYPEVDITLRNPNPLEHPRHANFAAVFAMNHEVEFRYPTDVLCAKEGKMPTLDGYKADCVKGLGGLTGDLGRLKDTSVRECVDWVRKVSEFQRANENLLLAGQFVDTEGFQATGNIIAKGFKNGRQLGVIVWNPESESVSFKVSVPGKKLVGCSAPGEPKVEEPFKELAPETIRLLIWE